MTTVAYAALAVYLLAEAAFYAYFHLVLVPRANRRQPPSPFLDYPDPTDRHHLLLRILGRLEQQAARDGVSIRTVLTDFFVQWFGEENDNNDPAAAEDLHNGSSGTPSTAAAVAVPSSSRMKPQSSNLTASTVSTSSTTSSSASSASDDASSISSNEEEEPMASVDAATAPSSSSSSSSQFWSIPGLGQHEMAEFLAWAFFTKEVVELTDTEQRELDRCLAILQSRVGLVFPEQPVTQSPYKARRLCLEDVSPLHRPMLVYIWVEAVRFVMKLALRCNGFRPTGGHAGLPGWYRPGRTSSSTGDGDRPLLPLVFFHGIAPAGLAFYLPMIFNLVSDGRPTLLVEQPGISGRYGTFGALSETEMMQAVQDMIHETIDADTSTAHSPLLWAGHSFGSCPLTWMLRHPSLRQRTAGLLLLDPVTILLSEPAVMLNFLYSRQISKIRMVAASELFTEYYLRRHFSWYNAEALWIDDNRTDAESSYAVTVALSACDEIVDAPKVASYLEAYRHQVRTIYWPDARHGYCISSPTKWRQLQQALWQQEDAYWQKQRKSSSGLS